MKRRITTIIVGTALAAGAAAGAAAIVPGVASAAGDSSAGSAGDRPGVVSRITDALKGLVSDGTITQDQADKVASTLAEEMPPGRPGFGGRGGHGMRGAGLDAAATKLGMTVDELRTKLESGSSLADVAKEKGVSEGDLVAAMVKSADERLAREVSAGRLTQTEADQRKADLKARITDMVERQGLPARPSRTW
jgi:hypothetical protein